MRGEIGCSSWTCLHPCHARASSASCSCQVPREPGSPKFHVPILTSRRIVPKKSIESQQCNGSYHESGSSVLGRKDNAQKRIPLRSTFGNQILISWTQLLGPTPLRSISPRRTGLRGGQWTASATKFAHIGSVSLEDIQTALRQALSGMTATLMCGRTKVEASTVPSG